MTSGAQPSQNNGLQTLESKLFLETYQVKEAQQLLGNVQRHIPKIMHYSTQHFQVSSSLLATSPALHIADILDPRRRSHHRDYQRFAGRKFTESREFCRRSVDTFAMGDTVVLPSFRDTFAKFYFTECTLTAPEAATCGDVATPTEMQSDAGQTMKPCLSPHHVDSLKRGPTPYLLSGFGCSFRYGRPILFAKPLPSGRVCADCRVVVPARALLLPCGHILCELCRDMCFLNTRGLSRYQDASNEGRPRSAACRQDGTPFVETDLQVLTFRLKDVHRELVFCVHAEFGCPYKGELRHLGKHYNFACRYHPNTCRLCGKSDIPACDIQNHVSYCAGR
ncbi:hypothetical protein HPB49_001029 [Dermacentor silvarum]|uniref:Uncharacterized protein n=1 Tax=Dermacentor silvarum TaxID=543639 RepID=A0ACB8DMK1_DERSI|nr:hypothetical protein HPB49_001029 [Dermacentor silvarum]